MARSHPSQKVILITGCSSGLGLAVARHLYRATQHRVIITARGPSLKAVQELFEQNERAMVRELDVTLSDQIHPLLNEVCNRWGGIDVLINAASICFQSVVEHTDAEAEELQWRTNYLGPMVLTKSILPLMREQRQGHIVNVSSVSGVLSMPTLASYSASKYALESASEALWYEGRPYGIKVTLVQPGFVNSHAFQNVILSDKAKMSACLRGPHSEFYDSMELFFEKWMRKSFADPDKIARKISRLIEKEQPPLRVNASWTVLLYAALRKVLPGDLFHRVMFKVWPQSRIWGHRKHLRKSS